MKKSFLIICILICPSVLLAQDLEDYLGKYTDENAYGYLEPLSEVFGSDINSGWFRHAHINHMKFQLYIGFVTTTGLIKNNQKTFDASSSFGGTVDVPTIFGQNESVRVTGPNGLAENYAGGANLNILPLAVPQASIGGLWGTEVSFRFFAMDVGEEVGKMDLFGWGIRHSISQYIEDFPVDLAVGYYNQSYKLGSYIDAKMGLAIAQADYSLGILDFYGGMGYEMNKMDIEYTIDEETNDVVTHNFENNPFRFVAGVNLNLGVFKIHGDYNLSKNSVFSLGMGLEFGTKRVKE
jgi:hypothetical protein